MSHASSNPCPLLHFTRDPLKHTSLCITCYRDCIIECTCRIHFRSSFCASKLSSRVYSVNQLTSNYMNCSTELEKIILSPGILKGGACGSDWNEVNVDKSANQHSLPREKKYSLVTLVGLVWGSVPRHLRESGTRLGGARARPPPSPLWEAFAFAVV